MRGIAYRRDVRARKISRKRRISQNYWYVEHIGMLDKGKIHCSCPMCSAKTKVLGPPVSEIRRQKLTDVE